MTVTDRAVESHVVDKEILSQIDAVSLSPRLEEERKEFFKSDIEIAVDRALLAMESWQETQDDVLDVRWARLVEKWAERLPVVIFKDQVAVGNQTRFFHGADPWVEVEAPNVLEIMEQDRREMRTSAVRTSRFSDEDWEAIGEAVHYFLGQTAVDAIFKSTEFLFGDWPEEFEKVRGTLRLGRAGLPPPVPRWKTLFDRGLSGIREEALAGIERVRSGEDPEAKKAWFWQAVVICCDAVIHYARRYSGLARDLAQDESNPQRREELERTADICQRVPEYPARTLREAVQSRLIWGIVMVWCRPQVGADESSRMDQDYYPYFIRDIREKRLTVREAADLVGTVLANQSRREGVRSLLFGQAAQGTLISNVALGGSTADGRDASNELTYLILHMAGLLKYAEPHYTFRVNAGTPGWIMGKALETNRKVGGGQPQFMSDERVINYLVNQGESLEDSRDWVGFG